MEPLQPETQTGRNTCTELDGFLGRGGFFFIKKKCNIIKPAYKPLEKISPSILVQNSHPISSLSHIPKNQRFLNLISRTSPVRHDSARTQERISAQSLTCNPCSVMIVSYKATSIQTPQPQLSLSRMLVFPPISASLSLHPHPPISPSGPKTKESKKHEQHLASAPKQNPVT